MEMPKPTQEHKSLERLAGTWIGEEKLHPSPWDPVGGPATGRVENRIALEGFALIQNYEQRRNDTVTFCGHGVLTWDSSQQVYVMHWWDSMGSPPNVFQGSFEGNLLVLSYAGPMGHHRTTFELSGESSYEFRMDVSGDGNSWVPFMEGHYTRQSKEGS